MQKKFYRNTAEAKLGGVCAGLGDYFEMDYNLIRLATVLLTLIAGGPVIVYIIAWIIVPARSDLN